MQYANSSRLPCDWPCKHAHFLFVHAYTLDYLTYVPRDSRREQKVIVKFADHWRIRNERHVLLRFQSRTSHTCIRPLLDEVEEDGHSNLALFLQHLDEVSWHTLDYRQLTRGEVKHVGKGVLERWKMKIMRLRF